MYTTNIYIPAYDASHHGLIIEFKIRASHQNNFALRAYGNVAARLQRNFRRIIQIMSSLKASWQCLESLSYTLECNHPQFIVKDAKSSSMALSIAVLNLLRVLQGLKQVPGLTGTGVLRIDGSFDEAHLQKNKQVATESNCKNLNQFITPYESKTLFDLECLINNFIKKEK